MKCFETRTNDVSSKPISLHPIIEPSPASMDNPCLLEQKNSLGRDLPDTEDLLFELDTFPLLNIENALQNIGSENLLHNMLRLMVEQEIPNDLAAIQTAHTKTDWSVIEKLAHKMKGSALYCGTIKLKYACQYLERYQKANHTILLEKLYRQLIQVTEDTRKSIQQWLTNRFDGNTTS